MKITAVDPQARDYRRQPRSSASKRCQEGVAPACVSPPSQEVRENLMIRRIRHQLGPWIGAAIIVAVSFGLFWMTANHAERRDGASPTANVGAAMSNAARQRMLTP